MAYDRIYPGRVWLDINRKPIQAHGFSMFYNEKGSLYYWENRGVNIPPQPDDLKSPLHPSYCMDRPHIIYCEKPASMWHG